MSEQSDLEISLSLKGETQYSVELRYSQPGSDVEIRLLTETDLSVEFDMEALRERLLDEEAYGRLLTQSLFAPSEIKRAFGMAQASAASAPAKLRLRLLLAPSASSLHSLRWETLRDPSNLDKRLTTDASLWFSRYVASYDWRPVQLRSMRELRALVVVANPADLSQYQLAEIDVARELETVRNAFEGKIPLTELATENRATLANIFNELRQGYDILYIVAHGTIQAGEPYLWLENDSGEVSRVEGDSLVRRMRELEHRPRLIVLASCQSAGTGASGDTESSFTALGPSLAEEGIPAVLAMQGNVSQETIARFMPVFLEELRHYGQIDRAVAVARGQVRERSDWWMPVLYMRLRSGRIGWYRAGFGEGFRKWPALTGSIRDQMCTPIVGLSLAESIIGTRRDIARRWAEEHDFPLAAHMSEGLPQVAQFLATSQDAQYARRSLVRYFCEQIRARYPELLSPESRDKELKRLARRELLPYLNKLMSEVWQNKVHEPDEPYHFLASLNLPIYLTADPTDLLSLALKDMGKAPRTEICPWNSYTGSLVVEDKDYYPSIDEPLVYHIFGRLEEPGSLVLTEDEYFEFLIGTANYRHLISHHVRAAFADTTLLFMGFNFDDWDFRVLFRLLMSQEGRSESSKPAHTASQLMPREDNTLSPDGAKDYLEEYFVGASINIFWGDTRVFVRELRRHLEGQI